MARVNALQRAQSAASMAATRLHRDLGTTFDGPVDVVGIARRLDLVLMMQPLETLLGFYVRGDETAGVVLNSQVPESLQRFTLAHEIGHHVLGHEGTIDDQDALDRFDSSNIAEASAQSFASSLVMPLPLVNSALHDLPAFQAGAALRPSDAYLFSRQLGVSFTAGVWALYSRDLLPLTKARAFIKSGALAAKNELRGSEAETSARADVWVLTRENNDLGVMCRVGDEIRVQLPELPSSGREWQFRSAREPELPRSGFLEWDGRDDVVPVTGEPTIPRPDPPIDMVRDDFFLGTDVVEDQTVETTLDPRAMSFPSGGGTREFVLSPTEEGDASVVLELVNAWDPVAATHDRYALDLHVRSRQLGDDGLLAPERDAWVATHAETG